MKKLILLLTMSFLGMQTIAVAQNSSASEPKISFKETTHDFGTVQEGPDYTYSFTVSNSGTAPLIIDKVNSPCGCTVPEWTKSPIMPGKSGEIKAIFHSAGRLGAFTKTLSVETNEPGDKQSFVTIKGEVRAKTSQAVK